VATSFESLHVGEKIDRSSFGVTVQFGDETPIARMVTEWADLLGAVHRRLEIRWVKPVRPGDMIQPSGLIKAKQATEKSRYVLIDVLVRNQAGEKVAIGEAMVEFPRDLICL
jgi:3-hydroxybutyryl-CoA dehydratase